MFSSSFGAAGNLYYIGKNEHVEKKLGFFTISGLVFHARSSRVLFQHAQFVSWEHVIMRKWRINREGSIIAMVVWYELVTTISRRLSERGILQWSSLLHTALRRPRYFVCLNVRLHPMFLVT